MQNSVSDSAQQDLQEFFSSWTQDELQEFVSTKPLSPSSDSLNDGAGETPVLPFTSVLLTEPQCFIIRILLGLEYGKIPHSPLREIISTMPFDLNPNEKAGLSLNEQSIDDVYSALDKSVKERVLMGQSVHKYWDR
ncbi:MULTISPECIES: hypothetical protein [unclassified Moraxella]|uniref:hypothetical protein n=1 Tax=unclassified Moraxella TaxID=2685852 RepID=UPI003AF5453E